MKKILLAGTALVGVAMLSQPAHADLKLDLQGYFRGYAVYADNDTPGTVGGAANNKLTKFQFMRDNEVHFTGQTTLDNGLTVGVHNEIKLGSEAQDDASTGPLNGQKHDFFGNPGDDPTMTDETYAYFQGEWGRVNLGVEDGAAYLLQVAAPSADSNIDGLRVYIQGFDVATWAPTAGAGLLAGTSGLDVPLGYDNADFRQSERFTYLTPKWNGFQAGASYAAQAGMQNPFGGTYGTAIDSTNGRFKDLWELAARWDGEFSGFGISAGAGYSGASKESAPGGGAAAGALGSRDLQTWDGGLNFTWQQFSLGGAYRWSNTGTSSVAGGDADARIWDVGLGWDNGPWHAGASYFDDKLDGGAYGGAFTSIANGATELTLRRETIGGGYTFGPGMTFRGSVALLQADDHVAGDHHPDQTQVTLGTDINF
jgi:hypothetical protein